jgi:hypothetical protein
MNPRRNPPLEARLKNLGLNQRQIESLLPELNNLSAPARETILAFAERMGKRALEGLRAALDAVPRLAADSPGLRMLQPAEPDLALVLLRNLPELERTLGPEGLREGMELAKLCTPGERADLVQRSPGLLGALEDRVAARLSLRLAKVLAQEKIKAPLAELKLTAGSVLGWPRPRLLLGLALRLAKERPASARNFLQHFSQGPARSLRPRQICAWVMVGLRFGQGGGDFFAPDSLAGLTAADRLSHGLSLARLFSWLGPYASLHAGRSLRLKTIDREASLPHMDLDDPGLLSLPHRLEQDVTQPLHIARALAVLGARMRRLGYYELDPACVRELLAGLDRRAPSLQELPAPALFCSGFSAPLLASALLALVTEVNIRASLRERLPGLKRDFAALDLLRRESPPPWPALEPAERMLGLLTLTLAGGDKPPEVLPKDYELAQELAEQIQRSAPRGGPLQLMELTGGVYARLPEASPSPAQKLPHAAATGSTGPGGPRQDEVQAGPNTPLSNKLGPGADGAPARWDLDGQNQREPRLSEHRYPEWDPGLGRLATGRALVIERNAPKGDQAALQAAMAGKAALASSVERAFLSLAPSQHSWSRKNTDGPELDMNALVAEKAELLAGFAPRGLVFRRTLPRIRQISCGVLWDVSGSTRHSLEGGQLNGAGREQLEAAREALALFGRALSAAGDEFAMWAYSGVGPERVDFYLLKRFEQAWDKAALGRLAGLKPLTQNRDGAAIRHATNLLAGRPSRQRLLIIITDGRPDDYAYGPDVAGRDLALALGSAKALGVRPVAVLLSPRDRRPHDAYKQVPHIIIRELDGLARWLPRLYRNLTN